MIAIFRPKTWQEECSTRLQARSLGKIGERATGAFCTAGQSQHYLVNILHSDQIPTYGCGLDFEHFPSRLLVCDANLDVRNTLKELVLPLTGDLLPGDK